MIEHNRGERTTTGWLKDNDFKRYGFPFFNEICWHSLDYALLGTGLKRKENESNDKP